MTTVVEPTGQVDDAVMETAGALMERLFMATIGTLEMSTIYLGVKLGLYDALGSPRTAAELAYAAGIDVRYAQEWLDQQAISGLVDVVEQGTSESRRYQLSAAQTLVLANQESPVYAGALALLAGGCGAVIPRVVDVYRTGDGISFGEYGDDVRLGQGLFNRGAFLGQLTQEWLPSLPGIEPLLTHEGARALDLGCGVGWSSIALAQAYPGLKVHGVDTDDASIMEARRNAETAGVADRVRFEVHNADMPTPPSSYDVVFFFEALHDMAHPVEALSFARAALRPGGRVVVMDERAEEEFAPDGPPIERLLAAGSVLHCLPVGRSEPDSAGTGALFRPEAMRRYADSAGFESVEIAPIEHDMFRFYVGF